MENLKTKTEKELQKEQNETELLKNIVKNPVTKPIIIVGGTVVLLIGVGLLFKVLTMAVTQFKDFRDAANR